MREALRGIQEVADDGSPA